MSITLVLALITFFGWGTGDIFTIFASRKIGANITTFFVFLFSFILSLFFLPFVPHGIEGITLPLFLFNIFLGVLYVSGNVLISEAFRLSSAPLVGIIIQAFPAVVLLLLALIFKDVITNLQLLFIGVIFFGVILCSVDFNKLRSTRRLVDKGTFLAITAMICLSVYFTFSRILIIHYGWFLPSFIANACFPLIFIFIKKNKEKFIFPKDHKVLVATFMVGLLIKGGDFALNYGLSLPNASSIVAPIAGASPILFVVISYFVYKDRLTKQQGLGIITTLMGILLIAFFK